MKERISIESYLLKLSAFIDDQYGKIIREQFSDSRGSSELAMLQTPSRDEYEQLAKAVAIMTPAEKEHAENLTDEQIRRIADDTKIDVGIFAIFINGYALECRKRG